MFCKVSKNKKVIFNLFSRTPQSIWTVFFVYYNYQLSLFLSFCLVKVALVSPWKYSVSNSNFWYTHRTFKGQQCKRSEFWTFLFFWYHVNADCSGNLYVYGRKKRTQFQGSSEHRWCSEENVPFVNFLNCF